MSFYCKDCGKEFYPKYECTCLGQPKIVSQKSEIKLFCRQGHTLPSDIETSPQCRGDCKNFYPNDHDECVYLINSADWMPILEPLSDRDFLLVERNFWDLGCRAQQEADMVWHKEKVNQLKNEIALLKEYIAYIQAQKGS